MALELAVIFLLLACNGCFAMVEIAVVSSRRSRLRQLAESGDARAAEALALAESPNRFLPTIQMGITLIGVLAGAFGGATVARGLAAWLAGYEALAPWSGVLGVGLVVTGITFCSLVIGELVPKRIGLGYPERIARLAARPIGRLAWLCHPLVRLLGASTDGVLWLLRIRPPREVGVSEEDVRMLVREGGRSGVLLPAETEMVEAVLGLDQMRVRSIMTPRRNIVWLDASMAEETICQTVLESRHTYFPVLDARRDGLLGMVSLKDLFQRRFTGSAISLEELVVRPLIVPSSQSTIRLLEALRENDQTFALVADEFGAIIGLVTLHDVMETIVGDFPAHADDPPQVTPREDGGWLIDAMIRLDELEEVLGDLPLEPASQRDYTTLSGLVLHLLGHIPHAGETFDYGAYHFEVVDLDGTRIDKLLVTCLPPGSSADETVARSD